MRKPPRLSLLVAAVAVIVGACTAAGPSTSPTTGPDGSAPPSGGGGSGIDYPTGASDLVLRYEEGGGMMMVDWVLTQAPIFSLYGDGTVVFRDPAAQPPADESGQLIYPPFRTARLSEEQMQSLLDFAVGEGGLGTARERYEHMGVTDAGTTTFTITIDGQTKTVEIYALGIDESAPDQLARAQFLALAERLRAFDEGGAVATDAYVPHGWRAVLVESPGAAGNVHAWPWPDLAPIDFVVPSDDPNAPTFPSRVLTAEDVEAMGLGDLAGGLLGYAVSAPDGMTYSVPLRPLLPDEKR